MFGFFFVCCIVVVGTIFESVRVHKKKNELENTVWNQCRAIDVHLAKIKELNTKNAQLENTLKTAFETINDLDAKALKIYEECEQSKEQLRNYYEND